MALADLGLTGIDRWPVPHAAAVVVGSGVPGRPADPDGAGFRVLAQRGDIDWQTRIASVAKLLVAYACLIAVEERTIRLDDPCGPPGATLRHCLAHASGLAFDKRSALSVAPGRRRIYSNLGIEAAADHLATAAGMPFAEYLAAGVLEPLGMSSTAVRGSPAYDVWSTAADLARFAIELLSPNLTTCSTMAQARTPQFPTLGGAIPGLGRFRPCPWGLGFEPKLAKVPHWTGARNSPATFGHFGGAGTFLWVDPAPRLGLVVLTDREFGPWALDVWPRLSDDVLAKA